MNKTDDVHPWKTISLHDYEAHMKQDSVYQLQKLNAIMKDQINSMEGTTLTILGIAGGNGLEHIDNNQWTNIYGIDINNEYLEACMQRFPKLNGLLKCQCIDVTTDAHLLSKTDHIIANLFLEYIDETTWKNILLSVQPKTVSCVIQNNQTAAFVSDSPYCAVFDKLETVAHDMTEGKLCECMSLMNYEQYVKEEFSLPNGKSLLRLDFSII